MPDDVKACGQGESRGLTQGEIDLARSVFGNSIDYSKVRIHNDTSNCLQGENTTVTPNGELYCANNYCDDFSKQSQCHFIHEMTHVWQYQATPMSPRAAAAAAWIGSGFDYHDTYKYTLDPSKDLYDYNLEQMGDIMVEYYCYKQRQGKPPETFQPRTGEEMEKGMFAQMILKNLTDKHKQDPNDPTVKAFLDNKTIAFDKDGVAHYTQDYVKKSNEEGAVQFVKDQAAQKEHDAVLLKVMDKFIKDPTYKDESKHPKPFRIPLILAM